MVLYVEKPASLHTVHFFTSKNLIQWELASVTEGDPAGKTFSIRVPRLFSTRSRLGSQTNPMGLAGADSQYAVGSFDGKNISSGTSSHSWTAGTWLLCTANL